MTPQLIWEKGGGGVNSHFSLRTLTYPYKMVLQYINFLKSFDFERGISPSYTFPQISYSLSCCAWLAPPPVPIK